MVQIHQNPHLLGLYIFKIRCFFAAEKICHVILSIAKDLNTSTLCTQILHSVQNDTNQ